MKWWFWHSLVTTRTVMQGALISRVSCSWSTDTHSWSSFLHKALKWSGFCFPVLIPVTIVTSSISCYTHSWFTNKTKLVLQILFCMFPWVWECTSSSDAGGGFIIRECSDMIWLWCWYSIINCLLWCGLWVCDGIAQNWIEASKWVKRKRWIFTFKIIHVMIDDCHWSFFSVP